LQETDTICNTLNPTVAKKNCLMILLGFDLHSIMSLLKKGKHIK
jgi:hypothetical protein